MSPFSMTRSIVFSLLTLLLAGAAFAKDMEALQPKVAPSMPKHFVSSTVVPPHVDAVNLKAPALRGLLVSVRTDMKISVPSGVTVDALPGVDSAPLSLRLQAFMGKKISKGLLDDITRSIVLYYKENSALLVNVLAPAGQDISLGDVRFVVIPAKLGKISVKGNTYFSSSTLLGAFRTQPGDALSSDVMLADLDWVNRNPFRRVDMLYKRGENPGEADVVLQTADRKPWRVYAGLDDTGTDLTGNTRVFAGFNLGNLFCCGHQLNYQFTASDDFEKMQGHALSYVDPLPWHHLLTLSATYQEVKPDVAAPMKSNGFSYDFGARYTVPLKATLTTSHDVFAGYNFKRSNNNLEFGGTQVFNSSVDISQFSAGYSFKQEDIWGDSGVTAMFVGSPGGLTDKNSDAAFALARADSSADYLYATLNANRTTLLPQGFSLLTLAEAQWANDRLPGSEELTVGGYQSVRGYSEGSYAGDKGLRFRAELRTPRLNSSHDVWNSDLRLLAFTDYATVVRNSPIAGETARDTLLSVGPGLRYRLGSSVDMRFDYGFQLRNDNGKNDQRAHFALTVSY